VFPDRLLKSSTSCLNSWTKIISLYNFDKSKLNDVPSAINTDVSVKSLVPDGLNSAMAFQKFKGFCLGEVIQLSF